MPVTDNYRTGDKQHINSAQTAIPEPGEAVHAPEPIEGGGGVQQVGVQELDNHQHL
jgi:hypothetical protein